LISEAKVKSTFYLIADRWEHMLRKVFKIRNSLVIALPKDALDVLSVSEGSCVSIVLDRNRKQIVIPPAEAHLPGVEIDEAFAKQVAEFIARYRSALEALAGPCLSDC
jgi:antitoxin component of MazEF toxin-antitoxin module